MTAFKFKTRLWLLTAVIILPMFVLNVYLIGDAFLRHFRSELTYTRAQASVLQSVAKIYFEGIWDIHSAAGDMVVEGNFTPEELSAHLLYTMDSTGSCMMEVATLEGLLVASTRAGAQGSIVHYSWFHEVFSQGRFISGIYDCPVTQQKMFYVTSVVGNEQGVPAAIITSGVYLHEFRALFPNVGTDHSYGITNSQGVVVFGIDHSGELVAGAKVVADSAVWQVVNNATPVAGRSLYLVAQKRVLGVALPISDTGWVSFSSSDWVTVRNEAIGYTRDSILVLLVTILLSFFFSYYLSREVVVKADMMQGFAQQAAAGSYSQRINCKGDDELSIASQALDNMAERIEELEKIRTLFIQAAAHELRNPMTAIKGIVTLMKMRDKGDCEHSQMLKILASEVERLSSLQDHIIEAFRTQTGNSRTLPLSYTNVELRTLVQETLAGAEFTDPDHNYLLEADEQVWVTADPARLGDVLRNLLSNAAKYSPANSPILVSVTKGAQSAFLSVTDQGIGIPRTQQEEIFESFTRGNNLEGQDPGGMGLGLYICRDILHRHGGSITVRDNPQGGSVFVVELPLTKHQPTNSNPGRIQ